LKNSKTFIFYKGEKKEVYLVNPIILRVLAHSFYRIYNIKILCARAEFKQEDTPKL